MNRAPTEKVRLNLMIGGRRTSLMLETGVWNSLTEICRREEVSLDELCNTIIDEAAPETSMASALRMKTLTYFLERARAA